MAYVLEAVIAAESLLRQAVRDLPAAVVVPIGANLALIPMTDELADSVRTGAARPEADVFERCPPGLHERLAAWSEAGPVAYVEAELFGGTGTQNAQVWDAGVVALGPLHSPEGEPLPAAGTPISQALRRLGVSKGDHWDEFDAVGLGRVRDTRGWLELVD